MKVVSIGWEDSRQIPGWTHIEELDEEICVCHTIGQLVKETGSAYYVTSTTADNGSQVAQVLVIPKCCVREIVELSTRSNEEIFKK